MKQTIRLTESDIRRMVMEAMKMLEYINPEGSLDDPNGGDPFGDVRGEIVGDYNGDEKAAENDYSWKLKQRFPSVMPNAVVDKGGAEEEMGNLISARNRNRDWTPSQLHSADKMKKKWINGERDLNDIDDAFYGSSLEEAVTRAIRKYLK